MCPFFPDERSIDGQRLVPNAEQASVIMLLVVIVVIARMTNAAYIIDAL